MLQISLYLGTKDSDSELCCEQFAGSWDSNMAGEKYEKKNEPKIAKRTGERTPAQWEH